MSETVTVFRLENKSQPRIWSDLGTSTGIPALLFLSLNFLKHLMSLRIQRLITFKKMATATRCLPRMKVHNLSGPEVRWVEPQSWAGRAGCFTMLGQLAGSYAMSAGWIIPSQLGTPGGHQFLHQHISTSSFQSTCTTSWFTLTVFWPRDDRCSNFAVLTCWQLCFTFILSTRGQLSKPHSVYVKTALFTLFSLYVGRCFNHIPFYIIRSVSTVLAAVLAVFCP